MRPLGPSPNFVFIDLSKLDAASAAAFLADRSQRTGPEALPSVCHWILSPARGLDLLSAVGPGPEFLRERLAGGDHLFCTNPTGFDWNHLFPSEAEQEIRTLGTLVNHEVALFLENTASAPPWLADLGRPVYRASAEGLCFLDGGKSVCLPWAAHDRSRRGVCWIVPGQALFSAWPERPWGDLPASLSPMPNGRPSVSNVVPAPTPAEKKAVAAVGLLRRQTTVPPLQQAILFRSSDYPGLGTKEAVDFDEALGGIRKRSLVANMQGQTDVAEGGLRVRFQGGLLSRIEDSGTGAVLCSGAESSIDWDGRRHRFTVNSAFSFEGDYSWGLRQSLVLQHEDLLEPGRAIFDFYFVEESREFFIAATVRWPRWKAPVTVTRWAPLELSLFEVPRFEPLTTRSVWPDGRSLDRIHRKEHSGELTGTDFVFSGGGRSLTLGFPQNQTPRPHWLPWKLQRGWSGSRVVVLPEGGQQARSSTEFEGIEEHFSFYLTQSERAKLPFSVTRKQAVELIPPYVVDADTVHHS